MIIIDFHKNMPRVAKNSAWNGAGRVGHFGTVEHKPIQLDMPAISPAIAPPGGVTKPPPNPLTGKPYRPGERLERQARQFLKEKAAPESKPTAQARPRTRRSTRDYEALIARALADMDDGSD